MNSTTTDDNSSTPEPGDTETARTEHVKLLDRVAELTDGEVKSVNEFLDEIART